jgi:hypothetical protein
MVRISTTAAHPHGFAACGTCGGPLVWNDTLGVWMCSTCQQSVSLAAGLRSSPVPIPVWLGGPLSLLGAGLLPHAEPLPARSTEGALSPALSASVGRAFFVRSGHSVASRMPEMKRPAPTVGTSARA